MCWLRSGKALLLVVVWLVQVLQLPALLLWQLLRMTGERRHAVASGLLRRQRRWLTCNDCYVTALHSHCSSYAQLLLLLSNVRSSGSWQCWVNKQSLLYRWCCLLQ
jgi:hypothetical protein